MTVKYVSENVTMSFNTRRMYDYRLSRRKRKRKKPRLLFCKKEGRKNSAKCAKKKYEEQNEFLLINVETATDMHNIKNQSQSIHDLIYE